MKPSLATIVLAVSLTALPLAAGAAPVLAVPPGDRMENRIENRADRVEDRIENRAKVLENRVENRASKIENRIEDRAARRQAIMERMQEKARLKALSTAAKEQLRAREPGERLYVRGQKMAFPDVPPVVKDGRTLVPVRAITEGLGAEVQWDPATRTVTITRDGKVIELVLGSITVKVDGEVKNLDVPAMNLNSRTLVPLRFISQIFGEKVDYDEETGEIDIGIEDDQTAGSDTEAETPAGDGTAGETGAAGS